MARKPTITEHGYTLIFVGKEHHLADVRGYAYEHRLVMEKKLGRRLKPDELVHHDDENPANNHPDNLFVETRASHIKHHKPRRGTGSLTCPKGHVKDYKKPDGTLICRTCRRAAERTLYKKKMSERGPQLRRVNPKAGEYNRVKTHCKNGHEYSPENTRRRGTRRVCRTCHRLRETERRKDNKDGE